MVETDEIDETIIRLLQSDGRMSNREIARQLNVSEGTVRQRLKRLVEAGAIRLGTVTDPVKLGITAVAYIRLRVQPGRLTSVLEALASIDEVYFAGATLGNYDVIAVAGARDRLEFARLVNDQISLLPGVMSTDVRDIVETYKHRFDIVRIK